MAVAGGQWRDAVRRRLAKLAERQVGVDADVRGEKARARARKSVSDVEGGLEVAVLLLGLARVRVLVLVLVLAADLPCVAAPGLRPPTLLLLLLLPVAGALRMRLFEGGEGRGVVSMSGMRLRTGSIAYNRLMKSVRSMSKASPCPDNSSNAVTMHCNWC